MKRKPYVVFVESNTSGTGRLFCEAARRQGLTPIVFCKQSERYPYLAEGVAESLDMETADDKVVNCALSALMREGPVAGIYSTSDYFLETASRLATQHSLPGLDPVTVERCRNKWLQRNALEKVNPSSVNFALAQSVAEAAAAANSIGYPVVAKPVAGTGSIGVKLCSNPAELAEHARFLLSRGTNERGMPEMPGVLVETYINGPEYSAEVFEGWVIGLTKKHLSAQPYFVELGHDFPADLSPSANAEAVAVVEKAVRALGLTWGPGHVEFRIASGRAVIIEVNPRLAGGYIPELIHRAFGVDLIDETVRLIAGQDRSPPPAERNNLCAAIRFLTCEAEGRLHSFEGKEEAMKLPGVVEVETYKPVGTEVKIAHDFRDRLGHVVAVGNTCGAAALAATSGLRKISVRIGVM